MIFKSLVFDHLSVKQLQTQVRNNEKPLGTKLCLNFTRFAQPMTLVPLEAIRPPWVTVHFSSFGDLSVFVLVFDCFIYHQAQLQSAK